MVPWGGEGLGRFVAALRQTQVCHAITLGASRP